MPKSGRLSTWNDVWREPLAIAQGERGLYARYRRDARGGRHVLDVRYAVPWLRSGPRGIQYTRVALQFSLEQARALRLACDRFLAEAGAANAVLPADSDG